MSFAHNPPTQRPALITLLTDFGTADAYVATMKGVILGIAPEARTVDITHAIPPQDIHAAAFVLDTAYRFFPVDTIHVVVVDPGVGGNRRALLVKTPSGRFLAPDNGVLSYVLEGLLPDGPPVGTAAKVIEVQAPAAVTAWSLENRALFRPEVSPTFHGRDIFAPVAARLALGLDPAELGSRASSLHAFPIPSPVRRPDGSITGVVLHVDAFGNLITNIRAEGLPSGAVVVHVGGTAISGLSPSYEQGADFLAHIESSGRLEIAVRNASAAASLAVGRGTEVRVEPGGARC